jgi:hypothetical protein
MKEGKTEERGGHDGKEGGGGGGKGEGTIRWRSVACLRKGVYTVTRFKPY